MIENTKKTALLVIDVQQGLFGKSTPIYQAETLLKNINTLVERAHQADVPVVYVQHADKTLPEGSDVWQLHPQLFPQPQDLHIHKHHGNAFEDTPLGEELQKRGVTRVVVTGLVTHGCVRVTSLGAKEAGYEVTLVGDAHSSYHKQAAEVIAEWNQKLAAQGVEVRTTEEISF